MRTSVTLDDDLVEKAIKLSGIKHKTALLNRALQVLIWREVGNKLAYEYGGSMPELKKEFNRDIVKNVKKTARRR